MPKKVAPDARRREVGEAVLRVVGRLGAVEGASYAAIAAESGLAVGSVRHYFPNHDAILQFAMQELADRVGVISKGELILVEEKTALMKKLGKKQLTLNLQEPMAAIPPELAEWNLTLKADGNELEYVFDVHDDRTGVPSLLRRMSDLGIGFRDLNTRESSLEDIFVGLVTERAA